jgi:hypothetical protein
LSVSQTGGWRHVDGGARVRVCQLSIRHRTGGLARERKELGENAEFERSELAEIDAKRASIGLWRAKLQVMAKDAFIIPHVRSMNSGFRKSRGSGLCKQHSRCGHAASGRHIASERVGPDLYLPRRRLFLRFWEQSGQKRGGADVLSSRRVSQVLDRAFDFRN